MNKVKPKTFKEFWKQMYKQKQLEISPMDRIYIYNLPYKIQDVQRTNMGLLISMDFHTLNDKEPQKIYAAF